jgi:hypothetical protein
VNHGAMESSSVLPKHVAEAKMLIPPASKSSIASAPVLKYYDAFIYSIMDKRLRQRGVEYLINVKLLTPPLTDEQHQRIDSQKTAKRREAALTQVMWLPQYNIQIWCPVDICRGIGADVVDAYEMTLVRNGWLGRQSSHHYNSYDYNHHQSARLSYPVAIPLVTGSDALKASLAIDATHTSPVTTLIEESTPKQPDDASILTRPIEDMNRMSKALIINDLDALGIKPTVYKGLLKRHLVTLLLRLINKLVTISSITIPLISSTYT